MKDTRSINFILLISLSAVLVLLLYIIYFLTPAFTDFLLADTEHRLTDVAEKMADSLHDQGPISYQSVTPEVIARVEDIRKTIALTKVKMFAVDSTIIYSTDPADIGKKSEQSFFPDRLASGIPRSYIATSELPGDSGKKHLHQVIETYVPIINSNFDTVGVFEIYYDITATNTALDRLTHRAYFVLLFIVLILLGAVLLSASRAQANMRKREFADDEIRRQKELLEHQHSELAQMHEQAQALSLQDHLTGLGNRRLLEIHFDSVFAVAHRYEKSSP